MKIPIPKLEKLIYPVGFYRTKARKIKEICKILIGEYHSSVPDEIDELLKLNGVGRKTANLVVTLGYKNPGICVDTHVHRITNRWGYVKTKNPLMRPNLHSVKNFQKVLAYHQRSPRYLRTEHLCPYLPQMQHMSG